MEATRKPASARSEMHPKMPRLSRLLHELLHVPEHLPEGGVRQNPAEAKLKDSNSLGFGVPQVWPAEKQGCHERRERSLAKGHPMTEPDGASMLAMLAA